MIVPPSFPVEVTVDDIIDGIARLLHGNFGGVQRFHMAEVTARNFHEVVKTPRQSVLLLTYDTSTFLWSGDDNHMAERPPADLRYKYVHLVRYNRFTF